MRCAAPAEIGSARTERGGERTRRMRGERKMEGRKPLKTLKKRKDDLNSRAGLDSNQGPAV